MVLAKTRFQNLDDEVYVSQVHSFTRDRSYEIKVAQKYLSSSDRILIIDDFLAQGNAVMGLKDIIEQAGATLVGAGIVVEKVSAGWGGKAGGKQV